MRTFQLIIGAVLCIMGVLLVLFECAMALSEPHSFWRDGWIPFTVFIFVGVVIFIGGILLYIRR
mgnify:CR=1 FL=1